MKRRYLPMLSLLASLGSAPLAPIEETLVITSGFDGSVETSGEWARLTLAGADPASPEPNDWSRFGMNIPFGFLTTGYKDRSAFEVVPDPSRPGNRVLRCRILDIGEEKKNGRAQGSFMLSTGESGRLGHQRFRFKMYIPEDWKLLADMPANLSPQWTDFFEIWAARAPATEEVKNGAGAFRVSFSFEPDRKGGFFWHLGGQNTAGTKSELWKGWSRENTTIPVPFGKWCEWEFVTDKGPDPKKHPESRAAVIVRMKTEGQPDWITLFEVKDERVAHERIDRKGWYQVAPFKNYLGPKTVEHLLAKGATDISLYYDDFSYWVGESEE